jgi:hypothetical protein
MTTFREPSEHGKRISALAKEMGESIVASERAAGHASPSTEAVGVLSLVIASREPEPGEDGTIGIYLHSVIGANVQPLLPALMINAAKLLTEEARDIVAGTSAMICEDHAV